MSEPEAPPFRRHDATHNPNHVRRNWTSHQMRELVREECERIVTERLAALPNALELRQIIRQELLREREARALEQAPHRAPLLARLWSRLHRT